ncbi:hypothetical protein [Dictyobacter arantiisoli]|uniref:Uncharacterized protein n=1 Tax=Dictyobacter arantiisoli TaxID=2014874 RepID=A0A5A5TIN4_9CHLR|nr:hypothetical protein [Dictyobacter arantiisoli]GCF11267.1 hypothetical protein KDI_48310 [Dictyobacter arantiisoli]
MAQLMNISNHSTQSAPFTSATHTVNVFENSLTFRAGAHTIDLCSFEDEQGLVLAVSDAAGNGVAEVTISPAVLKQYLDSLAEGKKIAC